MEFDKSRVYTAVNADELKIGSKCIFSYCLFSLKDKLRNDYPVETLIGIRSDTTMERFESDYGEYPLAYLVVPPKQAKKQKEPQYKPFSSIEKAKEIIEKHGGWVFERDSSSFLITGYDIVKPSGYLVYVGNTARSLQYLFEHFIFDDGSPCGELAEE